MQVMYIIYSRGRGEGIEGIIFKLFVNRLEKIASSKRREGERRRFFLFYF